MAQVIKRFISHATVATKLYTSKRGKVVKDYLEHEALKEWAAKTRGVDDSGAEVAEVVSAGHEGGTVASEPFHLGVHVTDAQGNTIPTVNPHTQKPTNTWHAYLANDKNDLYAKANAWYKKQGGK